MSSRRPASPRGRRASPSGNLKWVSVEPPKRVARVTKKTPLQPSADFAAEEECRNLFCAHDVSDKKSFRSKLPQLQQQERYQELLDCGRTVQYTKEGQIAAQTSEMDSAYAEGRMPRRVTIKRGRQATEFCTPDARESFNAAVEKDPAFRQQYDKKVRLSDWYDGNWDRFCTLDYMKRAGVGSFDQYKAKKQQGQTTPIMDDCVAKVWGAEADAWFKDISTRSAELADLQVLRKSLAAQLSQLNYKFVLQTRELKTEIPAHVWKYLGIGDHSWVNSVELNKSVESEQGQLKSYLQKIDVGESRKLSDYLNDVINKVNKLQITAENVRKEWESFLKEKDIGAKQKDLIREYIKLLERKLSGENFDLKLQEKGKSSEGELMALAEKMRMQAEEDKKKAAEAAGSISNSRKKRAVKKRKASVKKTKKASKI